LKGGRGKKKRISLGGKVKDKSNALRSGPEKRKLRKKKKLKRNRGKQEREVIGGPLKRRRGG